MERYGDKKYRIAEPYIVSTHAWWRILISVAGAHFCHSAVAYQRLSGDIVHILPFVTIHRTP